MAYEKDAEEAAAAPGSRGGREVDQRFSGYPTGSPESRK
tara:strand:- start:78 stop:194 length:117 start_codon:yes stop_codon:yes gene_type:complete